MVQWLRLHLLRREVQVPSLTGEIRSHMLVDTAKFFLKRIPYIKYIYIYHFSIHLKVTHCKSTTVQFKKKIKKYLPL